MTQSAGNAPARRLLTVGHGALSQEALAGLLTAAGVEQVLDIRRFPGSRGRSYLTPDELAGWLGGVGVAYRWDARLGGRRRLSSDVAPVDTWWTVPAFRAYAAHTRTPEFQAGLSDLLTDAAQRLVAIMCSESVWWRCHRRLVSDVCVLTRGIDVQHLMADGKSRAHEPAVGARRDGDVVVWDRVESDYARVDAGD